MKIRPARALARMLGVLYRLGIISIEECDRLTDELTVSVLKDDISKRYPKEYLLEDVHGESNKETK